MAAAANGWPERGLNAVRRLLAGAAGAVRRQLANAITLARLVAVLPIWMLIEDGRHEAALLLFSVAAVSDAVDGAVAKLLRTASAFGAVLDPLVDKLMLGCLFIIAGTLGWTSLWLVALVVGRDMALAVGVVRLELLAHSRRLEPLLIGKLCTMTQFFFFGVLLAETGGLVPFGILHYLAASAVVLTALASLAAYLWFARAGAHAKAAGV
ncbi:MAG: CDP-alcohol phosphatidyltransferase family protein [Geminicoccaceae bacterium]|jgi:cardiolipin synthase|nr:CDP-alcohol phosphatidyltransferase family protein [Geminicoccaceae bacterium]MCB9967585.1 CDP-alcohol phosphatidyltransferase family protein [Geminicoccaceae bacterium]HRY25217.1 CDP-alcohol phosphatidyltransferase family protein [Geminicoccaceae bacterium]